MNTHIIDFIGKDSLVHTELDIRKHRPTVGDPVIIHDACLLDAGYKLKNDSEHWRIDTIETNGKIYLVRNGSFFWCSADTVSVSGGPFSYLSDGWKLAFSHSLKQVRFWNWGCNGAGASNAVYYNVDRPIWMVIKE